MRKKRSPKRHHILHRIKHHLKSQHGFVTILLLIVVIGLAILLSGILKTDYPQSSGTPLSSAGMCCDSGDGPDCHPSKDKTFTFDGQEYGLLKSGVTFAEGNCHLKDTGQKDNDGDPIIQNTSDGYEKGQPGECGATNGQDQVWGPINSYNGVSSNCTPIPNDEIIYVCKSNCVPGDRSYCPGGPGQNPLTDVYGTDKTTYDVYFKSGDYPNPGVPPVVKDCVKTGDSGGGTTIVPVTTQPDRKNLQLQTFTFKAITGSVPWVSPWCKPAVYLYPESTSYVNVKVDSSEPFTYTDPLYPSTGWNVLADSNGILNYGGKLYDYLYYETKVADSLVKKPDGGFVVEQNQLSNLFETLLPRLGLNSKEAKQFSDYWLKSLPSSPYYFVGIVPKNTLDSVDSLDINPKPSTVIRVTLYFETLNQKIEVNPPIIQTPARNGFTVVEWGGVFKKHPNEPFSCLM